MRRGRRHQTEQEAHFFAAGQFLDIGFDLLMAEAHCGSGGAHFCRGRAGRHDALNVQQHAIAFGEFVQLVLREIADPHGLWHNTLPTQKGKALTNGFDQRRLALSVRADNGNPVVRVQTKVHLVQNDRVLPIAERGIAQLQHGRGELVLWRGEMERRCAVFHRDGDVLHLFEHLDAGLGLTRLGRLGTEPVDKCL